MDMLQRNPRDPKHREFHDGEYEYWPAKAPGSGRSIGFPAACLAAALAAAALLTAALTMLYSQTSPKVIYEDFAIVNVNIYNNVEDLDIRYTLSPTSDPGNVLQEGVLEYSEHTLNLQGLTPGTQYILQYTSLKDGVWNPIGDFQFWTPGDPPEQSDSPLTTPAEPASGSNPASGSEPMNQAEAAAEATEATMETEETTEPTKPTTIWRPQKPKPAPDPTPEPAPAPTPKPTPETTPETTPEPIALEPEIGEVWYRSMYCGYQTVVTYSFPQTFRFQNISSMDEIKEVVITRDGKTITQYTKSIVGNILSVTFNGSEPGSNGDYTYWIDPKTTPTTTTTVTVVLNDGTSVEATKDIVIPYMTGVTLKVTKNDNDSEDYTYTITVETTKSDYKLELVAKLYIDDENVITVNLEGPEEHVYTGTYTTQVEPTNTDLVEVAAIWLNSKFDGDVSTKSHQTIIANADLNFDP